MISITHSLHVFPLQVQYKITSRRSIDSHHYINNRVQKSKKYQHMVEQHKSDILVAFPFRRNSLI